MPEEAWLNREHESLKSSSSGEGSAVFSFFGLGDSSRCDAGERLRDTLKRSVVSGSTVSPVREAEGKEVTVVKFASIVLSRLE